MGQTSWRTQCRGPTTRVWSLEIRGTANTSTHCHVPRVQVFPGWLLRPDSARENPRACSSGRKVDSWRPWPLGSPPSA
eukprot:3685373-Pleurochrysis_carterae.AAC.1